MAEPITVAMRDIPRISRFRFHRPLRVRRAPQTRRAGVGSQIGASPLQVHYRHPHDQRKFVNWCAVLVVCVYFIRGTMLPRMVPLPASVWMAMNILTLFYAVSLSLANGGTSRWSWGLLLFAFAPSICLAEQKYAASFRWGGLVLLLLAVGPVVVNPSAIALRAAMWRFTVGGITYLTLIFTLWYALHIPSVGGRGLYFNGFMNQSMLLGPIAGLGVVIAMARAINARSWRWGLVAIISLFPVMASGSRLAAVATLTTGCFLLIWHKPAVGILCGLLLVLAAYSFTTHMETLKENSNAMSALANKGLGNSRAERWEDRIADFKSSPFFGVGIGMGTDSRRSGAEEAGVAGVEPGSSYLGILAMTGLLGSVFFLFAVGLLVYRFIGSHRKPSLEEDILRVVGIFLAVHGVAEGWILGFGSPLCFLFWLCLGNMADSACRLSHASVRRNLRPSRWVGLAQPAFSTS